MNKEFLQSTLFLSPVQQGDKDNFFVAYSPNLEYASIDTRVFKNLFFEEEKKNEINLNTTIKLSTLIHLEKINDIKSLIKNEFEILFEDEDV